MRAGDQMSSCWITCPRAFKSNRCASTDRIYYPAHGDPVENPQRFVRGLAGHRRQREGQILRLLGKGEREIPAMVGTMYKGLDPRLFPAAGRSVLAHLIDLRDRGMVTEDQERWALV